MDKIAPEKSPLYPPNGGLRIVHVHNLCSFNCAGSEFSLTKLPSLFWGRAGDGAFTIIYSRT